MLNLFDFQDCNIKTKIRVNKELLEVFRKYDKNNKNPASSLNKQIKDRRIKFYWDRGTYTLNMNIKTSKTINFNELQLLILEIYQKILVILKSDIQKFKH